MNANSLVLAALGLALLHEWLPAQAKPTASAVSHSPSLALAQGMRARPGFSADFAAAPARVNEASSRRFPAFYVQDTPFATQVRVPVAHLGHSRLHFEAFYSEISVNNLVRGVPQLDFCPPMPGVPSLRPARSYGIALAFPLLDRGARAH